MVDGEVSDMLAVSWVEEADRRRLGAGRSTRNKIWVSRCSEFSRVFHGAGRFRPFEGGII